jgi:gas vesicle structural protein
MAVERAPSGSSLIDVLDRVLDKGIVIDAYVRVSLVGIDLVTVEARVVVASIDTYLKYSEAVGITAPVARPRDLIPAAAVPAVPVTPHPMQVELDRVMAENAELRRRLDALS